MRELILHIGMHKTGTTSIQSSLNNFDNGLVRYARLCDVNHSIPIYSMFASDRLNYHVHRARGHSVADIERTVAETRTSLDRELELGRGKLIVSGEDISLIDPDGVSDLFRYLKSKVERVRVLAYVRGPLGFASSALQQRIKGGGKTAVIPTPEYRKRFKKYINCFGPRSMEFVSFEECLSNGSSIVQDFCNRVGIDCSEVEERRANESTSLECIQMINLFNHTGMSFSGNMRLFRTRMRFMHRLSEVFPGPGFKVPIDCLSACVDWGDVSWMEEASGITLAQGGRANRSAVSREDAVSRVQNMLKDVSVESVVALRSEIAKVDASVAASSDATGLLNFLYLSLYFDRFANS